MTYVVTESCIKCKYTDCVDVCPVDCFREGPNMLVIEPDECIDCTLCVAECPVDAIFAEDDVPVDQRPYIALNADLAKAWPSITEKKDAPGDADEWAKVKEKNHLLEPRQCRMRPFSPAPRSHPHKVGPPAPRFAAARLRLGEGEGKEPSARTLTVSNASLLARSTPDASLSFLLER